MGIKNYKPNTAGMRYKTSLSFDEITRDKSEKSLSKGLPFKAGRGANGRISIRRRGRRHKRKYRFIDFKRDKYSKDGMMKSIPGKVASIEYDPNRSANIALIHYVDGEKRYILAPRDLKVGMIVQSGNDAPLENGNALPLECIPLGMIVHNIELQLGKGGQLVRSAGTGATIVAKEGDYVTLRLPSGEMRLVFRKCFATIGVVGNEDHMNVSLGKAGRNRWLGRRPKVRGVAMNPHDHPHGGGEGKASGGRHPVTPGGVPTKGYKTRKKRKTTSKFIIKKRK